MSLGMIPTIFIAGGILVLALAEEPPTVNLAIASIILGVILGVGTFAMKVLP